MYARAFLEGRLGEQDLDGFRQEKSKAPHGLSSYPHPRLMPEFWQFPTVSMGLGPINAIYQAQSNKYLTNRGIKDASDQHVWAFLGDGEMDEVESRGALQWAANEKLDNLTFVINCNLQRLDGPVRGNGKIIQELESFFRGAGWNVIKVVWGREWDDLLAADTTGALVNLMNVTPDGDYQTYKAENGAYVRENFFGRDPVTAEARRGLHRRPDLEPQARRPRLPQGLRGVQGGDRAQGPADRHPGEDGQGLRPRPELRGPQRDPPDEEAHARQPQAVPRRDAHPDHATRSSRRTRTSRRSTTPAPTTRRSSTCRSAAASSAATCPSVASKYTQIALPDDSVYEIASKGSGKQEVATTMAFARLLKDLLSAPDFGQRIVPIIPDEARTFGMDAYFPTAKIYNPNGQHYTSVDRELLLAYKESPQGQIIHVGINEAGAFSAFTAAGTAYATQGEPLIPVYVFYSMFGFQRTGDAMWAAGDQMARGFIMGATAGRTTLTGEGLQHADGHSHLLASTNPAVVATTRRTATRSGTSCRPASSACTDGATGAPGPERHVLPDGLQRADAAARRAREPRRRRRARGIYKLKARREPRARRRSCWRPASACRGRSRRRSCSRDDWNVAADVWSVTSWTELRRDGLAADEHNFLHPERAAAGAVPVVEARRIRGSVRRGLGLHARGARPDPAVRARRLRDARCRRLRLQRHPRGGSPVLQDRRPVDRGAHAAVARAPRARSTRAVVAQAIEKYRLHDVTAGTTGSAGGES